MLQHPAPHDHLFDDCALCDLLREQLAEERRAPLHSGRILLRADIRPGPEVGSRLLSTGDPALTPVGFVAGGRNRAATFSLAGGGSLAISAGSRSPWIADEVMPALRRHPLWRSAQRSLRRYRAAWNVYASPPEDEPIPAQLRLTAALAAVANVPEALGVAWDAPLHAIPLRAFRAEAAAGSPEALPIRLWVRPTVAYDPDADRVDVLSWGLGHLGSPEISIDAPARRRREAIDLLYARAAKLLDDGDITGFTMRDSPVYPGSPVLQLIL